MFNHQPKLQYLHEFVIVDRPQFAIEQSFPKMKNKNALICKLHIFFLLLMILFLPQALRLRMRKSTPSKSCDSFITGSREIGLSGLFPLSKGPKSPSLEDILPTTSAHQSHDHVIFKKFYSSASIR